MTDATSWTRKKTKFPWISEGVASVAFRASFVILLLRIPLGIDLRP